MGDAPFDFVECFQDTIDYVKLKIKETKEFFNPPDASSIENKRVCLLCFESGEYLFVLVRT